MTTLTLILTLRPNDAYPEPNRPFWKLLCAGILWLYTELYTELFGHLFRFPSHFDLYMLLTRRILCAVADNCAPNPCKNGICENEIAGYLCQCNHGYTGRNCETGKHHDVISNAGTMLRWIGLAQNNSEKLLLQFYGFLWMGNLNDVVFLCLVHNRDLDG